MIRRMLLIAATVALSACSGDDDASQNPAPVDPGAGSFVMPTPIAIPLSAAGPDQLQSAAAGPSGTFYAAGFAASTVTGPRMVTVVKLTSAGALDTSFGGGDGIASTTVEFAGGGGEIDVATQPSGKIVVAATVPNAANASDRDVAVLRLNADGTVDPTFGTGGVRVLDLSTAVAGTGTALVGLDASRDLAIDATGVIYIHAAQRAEGTVTGGGPRTDTDFVVVRLTADGAIDTSFGGGDGKHLLDIAQTNATPRGIAVLADGNILASGYANTSVVSGTAQPVLYKLTSGGVLDPSFASGAGPVPGVFHASVATVQTEIYSLALHGSNVVTAGYGRNTGTTNDWISMRFNVATGARDQAWGGASNGAVMVDPSGASLGSNCRYAVGLPNGKTILVGSTGPGNQPTQDAAFAVLGADGVLDTAYGDGVHSFKLGADGNDQFWGGAVSGSNVLLVGYEGGLATQSDTRNDNAYVIVMPLR